MKRKRFSLPLAGRVREGGVQQERRIFILNFLAKRHLLVGITSPPSPRKPENEAV